MTDLLLQNIARHIRLTDEEFLTIRSYFKPKKIRKRQYLLQAGDVCRFETFVTGGLLRAYSVDITGIEHIAMFAQEGWWISDLYSLLTGMPATLNIDALEDTEVLQIEKPDLEKLYEEIPALNKCFRILFQNAFVSHQERILASISKTADERYELFLKKYSTLEQRIPQHQVASFLGITPETLSRIRKKMTGGK